MIRAAVVVFALLATAAEADVFSPGELAKPHSNLEGLANCTKCHPEGGRLSQGTCLACHTELKPGIAAHTGFHGRIAEADRACESCHADHQGLAFALVNWGPNGKKGFEHGKTGWSLKGKHSGVKCDVCHEPRLVQLASIAKLIVEQPDRHTSLGLGTACTSCHFDEHRGQFKEGCQTCHQETGWKTLVGFSHDTTNYPLKGLHTKVACEKCHPSTTETVAVKPFPAPVSETFMRFAPLESGQCTNCHKDPHDNRFGPKCSSCHSVSGWLIIRNAAQERGFHDQTRFKLKGEHLDVPCTSCHGPWPGQKAKFKNMEFDQCTDCHADAHEGQLAKSDCKTCHSVEGFSPPKFTLADHQKTTFVLEGAHQVANCASCHQHQTSVLDRVPATVKKALQLQRRPQLFSSAVFDRTKSASACAGCHADVHQGQFEGGRACESCHVADTFHQVRFNHATDSRYPLTGKHAEVTCAKCHAPNAAGLVRYKPLETTCESCHADVHVGQFAPMGCASCHTTAAFKPASGFSHGPPFTTFLLEGKHADVACKACHPSAKVASGATVQRFVGAPTTCEGCHSDFHKGAFQGFVP